MERTRGNLNIAVTIPCFNEEQFIGDTVSRAKAYADSVIVIDDGSTDNTAEVARAAGAQVIKHEINKGYGESIKSCFKAAKANDADIVITLDGDGQHNPDEIPKLLTPILDRKADLVIGSRFLQSNLNETQPVPDEFKQMPKYRKFGIDVITFLYNFGSKVRVSDAVSGFRAYTRRVFDNLSFTEDGMSISVEIMIKSRRQGFKVKEVPISCVYHSQSSTLNPATMGIGLALSVIRLRSLSR